MEKLNFAITPIISFVSSEGYRESHSFRNEPRRGVGGLGFHLLDGGVGAVEQHDVGSRPPLSRDDRVETDWRQPQIATMRE